MGHPSSRDRLEAHAHWHPAIDRERALDSFVCRDMEALMDELKWELLTEVQGRLEADLLKSYFEAYGIDVELFQESVGHHIYPVTVNGLGRVQLFVSKKQASEAHKFLNAYNNASE